MKEYEDLTIITPTLNEEKNILELIPALRRLYKGATIIVADDGSKDSTRKIVKEYSKKDKKVILLDRSKERIKGLTASALDGVKITKTPYLIIMDSDLQHPPKKVGEIYRKIKAGYDIVIGTRERVEGEWGFYRKLMSKIATCLARIRLLRYVKDPMSGFFGTRTAFFHEKLVKKEHRFVKEGFKILFDLLKVSPFAKICKVYYVFDLRKSGESKIGKKAIKGFLKSLI
ncbi:MAG: glycosyltransferase [Candidatus Pacearchaeota archaeon]